jgi:hypothetical protein
MTTADITAAFDASPIGETFQAADQDGYDGGWLAWIPGQDPVFCLDSEQAARKLREMAVLGAVLDANGLEYPSGIEDSGTGGKRLSGDSRAI